MQPDETKAEVYDQWTKQKKKKKAAEKSKSRAV